MKPLEQDKRGHAIAGFAVGLITAAFYGFAAGVLAANVVGGGKEARDWVVARRGGAATPDLLDWAATSWGGVLGACVGGCCDWLR